MDMIFSFYPLNLYLKTELFILLTLLIFLCNFVFLLKVMDERWESEIIEYGAINITGFRILDTHKRYVKEFLDGWKKLDATTSPGAGKEQISVSEKGEKKTQIYIKL